jgi:hypothetical protein
VNYRHLVAELDRQPAPPVAVQKVTPQDAATLDKQSFVARQFQQAKGASPSVDCECGLRLPLRFMYRCLYCGQFYCQSCAEVHFGKTRAQYNAERAAS